jgi:DNA-binding CsgD family transcriptional regulator
MLRSEKGDLMDAARDLKARKKIEEALLENEAKAKAEKAVAADKPVIFKAEHDGIIFDNKIQPILDTKEKIVQLAGYCKNIAVLKKTTQALEEKEKELALKTKSLEEINTTMKVLLKKREEDKTEIENNVMTNVKELIAPYFDKIKETKLDDHQKAFLNILESNLNEIVSPFTRKLSLKYLSLTPKEILIVNMIKIGYPSKKIAKIMKISPRTVDTHRKNIRSKIGLGKKRANLRSHLLAYEQ